jgi:hypothetical protein
MRINVKLRVEQSSANGTVKRLFIRFSFIIEKIGKLLQSQNKINISMEIYSRTGP